MKTKHAIFLFTLLSIFLVHPVTKAKLPSGALSFKQLSTTWDEAIPLGNGMLGALIWQKGDHLRFSLDRADLWDLRPMANFSTPEFNFKWVQQQVSGKSYSKVQQLFDAPYDQLPAPSKIPGAALEFDTRLLGEVTAVQLAVKDALCQTKWANGTHLTTFVAGHHHAGWFRFENLPQEVSPVIIPPKYFDRSKGGADNPVTGQDLQRLGYEQGEVVTKPHLQVYHQKGWNGFSYDVAVAWKREGGTLTGVWTITSSQGSSKGTPSAEEIVRSLMEKESFDTSRDQHIAWWKDFWSRSSIQLPDSVLQKQWELEQYKFGSAARADAPPISLQAVWTADNGKLPPWKGDFHHDLNTQLSYWPAYSSNHLDLEKGFVDWLWSYREKFSVYTHTYFGTNGMNVPGVTTLTGEPMGGWIQYSLGPTVGCWLAQHFYQHWLYSGDENFLRERAYPWIRDVAIYLDELSITEHGKKRLPLSSSPEINDNSINAWFTQTTNFDLGMIRWTYTKAAELAQKLDKKEEAKRWKKCLEQWPGFAVDSLGGLAFAPGYPYRESHRHFSHLVGWHPLGIIDWSNGEAEQQLITATLKNLEQCGPDWWCGYSYSWLGNLYARAMKGDEAAKALKIFAENFCLSNSFHANGEQHDRGFSKMKYRPFTLEGNFAFAAGIQEMLLQSHAGVIKIFPAIPDGWKEVSFTTLRAAGAFLISASRQEGVVKQISIVAERGGLCLLKNPGDIWKVKYSWDPSPHQLRGELLEIRMPANGHAELVQ